MIKKFFLTALFTLIGFLAFAQERIAVFPFEDMDNIFVRNESFMFYQEFSNEFANIMLDRDVIPRQQVERLIGMEMAFQLSEFSAREKTAEMNRVLTGTQILSGYIARVGSNIRITVSLYTYPDLRQLPGGVTRSVPNTIALFDIIPELVQNMSDRITTGGTNNPTPTPAPTPTTPANMVRVEGGTFTMGSPSGGDSDERPTRSVTVSSFYMGIYEVTQREWFEVMGTTIRQQQAAAGGSRLYGEGDNYPMYYVSWLEAVEYCNKRSVREGLTPVYSGSGNNITCNWNANGYRLPTEAEWEYAAKGGNKDPMIYEYSGSNNVGAVAWYTSNSGGRTQPVGTKAPNSLGLYDMSGNVWEWCWDWYGTYPNGAQTDPRGASSGSNRVNRGGSWGDTATGVRSAYRFSYTPSFRYGFIGFRVVRP